LEEALYPFVGLLSKFIFDFMHFLKLILHFDPLQVDSEELLPHQHIIEELQRVYSYLFEIVCILDLPLMLHHLIKLVQKLS